MIKNERYKDAWGWWGTDHNNNNPDRDTKTWYSLKCFKCESENGKENWMPAVATGACAWCGYNPTEDEK